MENGEIIMSEIDLKKQYYSEFYYDNKENFNNVANIVNNQDAFSKEDVVFNLMFYPDPITRKPLVIDYELLFDAETNNANVYDSAFTGNNTIKNLTKHHKNRSKYYLKHQENNFFDFRNQFEEVSLKLAEYKVPNISITQEDEKKIQELNLQREYLVDGLYENLKKYNHPALDSVINHREFKNLKSFENQKEIEKPKDVANFLGNVPDAPPNPEENIQNVSGYKDKKIENCVKIFEKFAKDETLTFAEKMVFDKVNSYYDKKSKGLNVQDSMEQTFKKIEEKNKGLLEKTKDKMFGVLENKNTKIEKINQPQPNVQFNVLNVEKSRAVNNISEIKKTCEFNKGQVKDLESVSVNRKIVDTPKQQVKDNLDFARNVDGHNQAKTHRAEVSKKIKTDIKNRNKEINAFGKGGMFSSILNTAKSKINEVKQAAAEFFHDVKQEFKQEVKEVKGGLLDLAKDFENKSNQIKDFVTNGLAQGQMVFAVDPQVKLSKQKYDQDLKDSLAKLDNGYNQKFYNDREKTRKDKINIGFESSENKGEFYTPNALIGNQKQEFKGLNLADRPFNVGKEKEVNKEVNKKPLGFWEHTTEDKLNQTEKNIVNTGSKLFKMEDKAKQLSGFNKPNDGELNLNPNLPNAERLHRSEKALDKIENRVNKLENHLGVENKEQPINKPKIINEVEYHNYVDKKQQQIDNRISNIQIGNQPKSLFQNKGMQQPKSENKPVEEVKPIETKQPTSVENKVSENTQKPQTENKIVENQPNKNEVKADNKIENNNIVNKVEEPKTTPINENKNIAEVQPTKTENKQPTTLENKAEEVKPQSTKVENMENKTVENQTQQPKTPQAPKGPVATPQQPKQPTTQNQFKGNQGQNPQAPKNPTPKNDNQPGQLFKGNTIKPKNTDIDR